MEDQGPEYPEPAAHGYRSDLDYSDDGDYGYDKETFSGPDIQRPRPSYSPPEMMSQQHAGNYFAKIDHEYYSQYR